MSAQYGTLPIGKAFVHRAWITIAAFILAIALAVGLTMVLTHAPAPATKPATTAVSVDDSTGLVPRTRDGGRADAPATTSISGSRGVVVGGKFCGQCG